MFKKVVVADTCAIHVNKIFDHPETYGATTLVLGAIYFAIQVYGDFSGYSDIAIGTSRLFGIRLSMNFRSPFFARDIAEFWRRWHISLTTWFRDYLYHPLGGSRGGQWQTMRNTFAIFLVSGFWHGANWTFITWGLIHAVLFLPLLLTGRNRKNMEDIVGLPSWQEALGIAWTFMAFAISMVVFRSATVGEAMGFLGRWFDLPTTWAEFVPRHRNNALFAALALMFTVDWMQRSGNEIRLSKPRSLFFPRAMQTSLRWASLMAVAVWTATKFHSDVSFVYFQF